MTQLNDTPMEAGQRCLPFVMRPAVATWKTYTIKCKCRSTSTGPRPALPVAVLAWSWVKARRGFDHVSCQLAPDLSCLSSGVISTEDRTKSCWSCGRVDFLFGC